MGLVATAAAASSLSCLHHLSSSLLFTSSTSLCLRPSIQVRHFLPRISCSLSSSSSPSREFNISFAPAKPKPQSSPHPEAAELDSLFNADGSQLFIPWIIRDDDGNLSRQSHPPARVLHAMAPADTKNSKKKKKKTAAPEKTKNNNSRDAAAAAAAEPKYSKAARRFYNENFRDSDQRLSKVLAAAGVASRRNSEELIFEGRVTVNGSVCNTPQTRVDPARDVIYVNGNRLPKRLPSKDKRNPGQPKPRLFTVGRLDVATTGLIIVTNDGDFAQKLSHPSSNLSKEYIAAIEGTVSKKHLIAISEGTVIEGVHCVPDSVELLPNQPDMPRSRLRVVVHDGRNHEVRELVKNAGLEIYSLKRVRIGGYRLPSDLGLGKHVELKQGDLSALGWKRVDRLVKEGAPSLASSFVHSGLGLMTEEAGLKFHLFLAITREVDPYEAELMR
ncbi:hypothetical protein TIFTF001_020166 [Ficus carica]|uniref:RNA-binding S4 domain-containing protein n=1 Tax=Ficus carica TaxID=3494 RepID=A0AA88ATQ7_FICCA|nr:hypothetical protein TIFTF001_020166 [Ficus carica]